MRKYLWSAGLAALMLVVSIYGAVSYARRHPTSFMARVAMVAYEIGLEHSSAARVGEAVTDRAPSCDAAGAGDRFIVPSCTPLEPDPLPEVLAGQQVPALPPLEPIRLMPRHVPSTETRLGPLSPTARNPFPEIVPVAADTVDECPNVMPYCRDDETCPPPVMPYQAKSRSEFLDLFTGLPLDVAGPSGQKAGAAESSGQEEQEDSVPSKGTKKSADAVNQRLESILRDYQSPEKQPVQLKLDTMEFRPSDARKGEFDRIPF